MDIAPAEGSVRGGRKDVVVTAELKLRSDDGDVMDIDVSDREVSLGWLQRYLSLIHI